MIYSASNSRSIRPNRLPEFSLEGFMFWNTSPLTHNTTKDIARFCSDFRYESNGIFVLGVGFFFLQTNFDFLTSHF